MPLGVAVQWASWGLHPDYILSCEVARRAPGHRRLTLPIRAYAVSDDWYAPRAAVEALLAMYSGAAVELRDVTPASVGATSLGHFGAFRRELASTLWPEWTQWLLAAAETQR